MCIGNYLGPFMDSGTLPPVDAFCNDINDGPLGIPYQKDYRS
jgi:hypothetical protein